MKKGLRVGELADEAEVAPLSENDNEARFVGKISCRREVPGLIGLSWFDRVTSVGLC